MRRLGARWIANASRATFPDIAQRAGRSRQGFLLSIDGLPVAWTDPHGASIDWIG